MYVRNYTNNITVYSVCVVRTLVVATQGSQLHTRLVILIMQEMDVDNHLQLKAELCFSDADTGIGLYISA